MVATWLRALLFVVGGVTAAGVTAYVTGLLDPWLDEPPAAVAALPDAVAPEPAAPEPREEAPAAGATVPQPEDPATTRKQSRLIVPAFDLLRVEPDGSIVIAGTAAPEATVEIITGDKILGKATAAPGGDFATALDTPLEPGDYQIVLRSTTPDNVVATSTETALVSIPETSDGQVLALVEEPGKPAELITVPQAAPAEAADTATAPAELEADAGAKPKEAPGEAETAQDEQPVPQEGVAPEAVAQEGEPGSTPPKDVAEAPAPGETDQPDAAVEPDQPAEAGSEPAETPAETEVAAAPEPEPAAPTVEQPPADAPRVIVEAVEIEGDTVFVAGVADPGFTVRVYANDMLLGVSRASQGGRFLVEARRDLPVGDYIIRADLLGADGSVAARAAVPFEREPGEAIAAVAPIAPAEPDPAEGGEAAAPASRQGEEEASALETTTAEPAAPQQSEIAAAPETGADTEEPAGSGMAAAPDAGTIAGEPSETDVAAAPEGGADSEITAPKLESAEGAVIIRRGDSLWRISRRVYGLGVRYSTIYLANQDQIEDPDRIWPGQVFGVPSETGAGETADMEAIGEQAVSPDTESKIIR